MKKISIFLAIVLMITMFSPMADVFAETPMEIHVAVNGSDDATGTIDAPLATLDGARMKVRELRQGNAGLNITVLFHGGTYNISQTVKFDGNDSGTGTVTYKAYNNEEVHFTGSVALDGNNFETVTDPAVLAKMLPEARGKVMQMDLQEEGLDSIYKYVPSAHFLVPLETPGFPLLYVNNFEQSMAKWPNVGYTVFGDLIQDGVRGSSNSINPDKPYIVKYTDDRSDRWVTASEAIIEGFFFFDWAAEKKYISNIDTVNNTFQIESFTNYGVQKGKRYRVTNLLEELDIAGEFYIDSTNMLLYYYPTQDISNSDIELSVFKDTMINLENARNINFIGLNFEKTLGRIFDINNCENITIAGNKLLDIGQVGIYFRNSKGITIQSNDIGHMGASAIFESANGNRTTLESTNNKIINNRIFDVAKQLPTAGIGINVTDVGSVIRNNIIHNTPGQAIRYEGNDNIISHNEIYNVTRTTSDSGAIYAGRHFNEFGNEIAFNFIHTGRTDIVEASGTTVQGIFWDDQQSGQYAHHNVIHDYERGLISGGGIYNRIENNMIINSTQTMYIDDRGRNSNAFHLPGRDIYNTLTKLPYDQSPYLEKYPEMATILTAEPGPEYPHSNTIKDNLYFNNIHDPNINVYAQTYAKELTNNVKVTVDPGFIDPDNKNFEIMPGSPILEQLPGLAEIKFNEIGLVVDQYRTEIAPADLGFQLAYPANNSTGLETLDMVFAWDAAPDADSYTLKIATDPDMQNVVINKKVMYTTTTVNGLESGGTQYYWTVEAKNVSKQIGNTALAQGQPYTFTTTAFDVLDKVNLQKTIAYAEYTLDTMVEGSEAGQFKAGTKALLQGLLDEAEDLNALEVGRQTEVDAIVDEINNFIGNISRYIKKGYVGIENMLNPDDWHFVDQNVVTKKDDVLNISETSTGTTTYMKKDMNGGTMMCFDMKIDFDGGWGGGFSLDQTGAPGLIWDGKLKANGYLILFKKDMIELQRYQDGKNVPFTGEGTIIKYENLDNILKDKEWAQIQVGAIDVDNGTATKIVLKINGNTIYDKLDDKPLPKVGRKFTMNNFAKGTPDKPGVSLRASESLPTTDMMADIGYPEAPEMPFEISNTSISKDGGISAQATITPYEAGEAVVIFKLKQGTITQSIIAVRDTIGAAKTYTAQFPGYTGEDYTVEVFVWDQLDNSVSSIGIDLAEPVVID